VWAWFSLLQGVSIQYATPSHSLTQSGFVFRFLHDGAELLLFLGQLQVFLDKYSCGLFSGFAPLPVVIVRSIGVPFCDRGTKPAWHPPDHCLDIGRLDRYTVHVSADTRVGLSILRPA
jgi:hypothetical protein